MKDSAVPLFVYPLPLLYAHTKRCRANAYYARAHNEVLLKECDDTASSTEVYYGPDHILSHASLALRSVDSISK